MKSSECSRSDGNKNVHSKLTFLFTYEALRYKFTFHIQHLQDMDCTVKPEYLYPLEFEGQRIRMHSTERIPCLQSVCAGCTGSSPITAHEMQHEALAIENEDFPSETSNLKCTVELFPEVQSMYDPMRIISTKFLRQAPKIYYVRFWYSLTRKVLNDFKFNNRKKFALDLQRNDE